MTALGGMFLERSFSASTLARPDPRVDSLHRIFLGTNPQGYAGCCGAIRDMDHTASLRKIRTPVLIIIGDNDVGTPWTGHGEILAREIAGAKVIRLPAAHLSNIECPRSFTSALLDFLAPALPSGDQMRRSVLGDAYVDAAIARTTGFTRDFQDLITRYAWGAIWTRPGLDPRTRRLLVLTTTAALGRWEEFRAHLRAGLAHNLEPCDIQEALLQAAIYAGVPAANTGISNRRRRARAPIVKWMRMEHYTWDSVPLEVMSDMISRKVISGDKAMIAQVFLKKDAVVPEHHHESEQITYILAGALKFELEGREVVVRKGEVLRIPSNVPHRAVALEDTLDVDIFSPIRTDWLSKDDAYLRRGEREKT